MTTSADVERLGLSLLSHVVSSIAHNPRTGDVAIMRGGQVRWIVKSVTHKILLARRIETVRGLDRPIVDEVTLGTIGWHDIVMFGASTVTSESAEENAA